MFHPNPSPISIVLSYLKRYNDGEDVNSAPTVVVFDVEAFTSNCTPCSVFYNATFCDCDILSQELFKLNEKWVSW